MAMSLERIRIPFSQDILHSRSQGHWWSFGQDRTIQKNASFNFYNSKYLT